MIGNVDSCLFEHLLEILVDIWQHHPSISPQVRDAGPILILDNLKSHKETLLKEHSVSYRFLPTYSPFLNETEYANNMHKMEIHKMYRERFDEFTILEHLPWGQKIKKRGEWMVQIAYQAWENIPNNSILNISQHVDSTYFGDCLNKNPIL